MHEWIEFETPGAEERLTNTELADRVGSIEIRFSREDGVFDLMTMANNKWYMFQYSFTSLSTARDTAKNAINKSQA